MVREDALTPAVVSTSGSPHLPDCLIKKPPVMAGPLPEVFVPDSSADGLTWAVTVIGRRIPGAADLQRIHCLRDLDRCLANRT
jgi:hypothetical protein